MNALQGKVAIITGGGTGIGKSIATLFASEGASVLICGRRVELLKDVLETCKTSAGKIEILQADVSKEEDVKRITDTALNMFHRVDILVNNAGIDGREYIHEHHVEVWDRVMATNLRGPFLMARYLLPAMRAQKSGYIINIGSEAGLEIYEGHGAYGVAKHALVTLGEYIQKENQELGIHVNTICPGVVVTDMIRDEPNLHPEKSLSPEEIADLVLWLVTKRPNVKFGTPMLIQTMENPWQ